MDYAAYDYYDWVCAGNTCRLCDVLTGACCDPQVPNCFLPDSCANNPCLSGGTCIDTLTVSNNRDFQCICIRGLTGKYCQLIDDFTPQNILPMPIAIPVQSPNPPPSPTGGGVAGGTNNAGGANRGAVAGGAPGGAVAGGNK
jgi:hypothetical protein